MSGLVLKSEPAIVKSFADYSRDIYTLSSSHDLDHNLVKCAMNNICIINVTEVEVRGEMMRYLHRKRIDGIPYKANNEVQNKYPALR